MDRGRPGEPRQAAVTMGTGRLDSGMQSAGRAVAWRTASPASQPRPTGATGHSHPTWAIMETQLRIASLQEAINQKLLPKRRDLLLWEQQTNDRRAALQSACLRAVERIQAEAEHSAAHIVSLEAEKLARLTAESDVVAHDLDEIRRLLSESSLLFSTGAGPEDLPRLNYLEDSVAQLARKEIPAGGGVLVDDIEGETRLYSEVMARHRSLAKLLDVKDQMISRLLEERASLKAELEALQRASGMPQGKQPGNEATGVADGSRPAAVPPPYPVPNRTSAGNTSDTGGKNGGRTEAPAFATSSRAAEAVHGAQHRCDSVWVGAASDGVPTDEEGSESGRESPQTVPPRVSSDSGQSSGSDQGSFQGGASTTATEGLQSQSALQLSAISDSTEAPGISWDPGVMEDSLLSPA